MRVTLFFAFMTACGSADVKPPARPEPQATLTEPQPEPEPESERPPFTTHVGVKLHQGFATLRAEITNASRREQCLLFRTGDEDEDLGLLDASFGNEHTGAFPIAARPPKTCLAPGQTVVVLGRTKILSGCGSELEVHYSAGEAVARACPTCWRGGIDLGKVIVPRVSTMPCP